MDEVRRIEYVLRSGAGPAGLLGALSAIELGMFGCN